MYIISHFLSFQFTLILFELSFFDDKLFMQFFDMLLFFVNDIDLFFGSLSNSSELFLHTIFLID